MCPWNNFILPVTYFRLRKIILCLAVFILPTGAYGQTLTLSPSEVQRIGEKIFENECAKKEECLLEWNEGEEFLSLGIGHFIWYPQGQTSPFEESFPKFLEYLKSTGQKIPG